MNSKNIDVYTLIETEIYKLRKVGIETAGLDCRLLLTYSLKRHEILHNHQHIKITNKEIENFKNLIDQRLAGKPVSRIINKRNFWKREFTLNEATLDPRSDSETLIDASNASLLLVPIMKLLNLLFGSTLLYCRKESFIKDTFLS